MGWPQVIWIALAAAGLGISLVRNGEATRHNFVASIVGVSLSVGLLYWGGFFS